MKASEYIKALQQLIDEHGDCECAYLGDRGWYFNDESDLLPKAVKLDTSFPFNYHKSASGLSATIFDLFPYG